VVTPQFDSVLLLVIMASSQQWHAARNWKMSPWNAELGWDEWYEKVENTLMVQNGYIDSLQEDLRGVRNDVRTLDCYHERDRKYIVKFIISIRVATNCSCIISIRVATNCSSTLAVTKPITRACRSSTSSTLFSWYERPVSSSFQCE